MLLIGLGIGLGLGLGIGLWTGVVKFSGSAEIIFKKHSVSTKYL